MLGALPPSSSVVRLKSSADARAMYWPTSVEPVNEILSTPRWLTGGHAGLAADLDQADGRQRGLLGRLEDDRVARRQRRCELPRGDREREVPGRDEGAHTERHAALVGQVARDRDRRDLALDLGREARVVAEHLGRQRQVDACAHERRHALVERLEGSDLVGVALQQLGDPPEHLAALVGRHALPGVGLEAGARRCHGRVDVGPRGLGEGADDRVGGGIDRLAGGSVGGRDPLVPDQQLCALHGVSSVHRSTPAVAANVSRGRTGHHPPVSVTEPRRPRTPACKPCVAFA
jgi:hypothetical protein